MVVYDLFSVIHAAVTDLDFVMIKDFCFWSFGKCLFTRARNLCPILVLTFLLNGGLYQRMLFHCLYFWLLVMGGL